MDSENERLWASGMLSKNTRFRIMVAGPVSSKELANLAKRIKMDCDFLAEDEQAPIKYKSPTDGR